MLFAKMGMLRAVDRNVKRVFNPSRKDPHWGPRRLKRETEMDIEDLKAAVQHCQSIEEIAEF